MIWSARDWPHGVLDDEYINRRRCDVCEYTVKCGAVRATLDRQNLCVECDKKYREWKETA